MINTFYYFEGDVYETEEKVINATKNYNVKRYDSIETNKSWDDFYDSYYQLLKEGNSCLDSIEWAKVI